MCGSRPYDLTGHLPGVAQQRPSRAEEAARSDADMGGGGEARPGEGGNGDGNSNGAGWEPALPGQHGDGDPLRVYIAGPYTASTPTGVDRNILVAREAMAALLRRGHTPFCPHAMTARFERDFADIGEEEYLRIDLEWLDLCDAILLLPGWETSNGTLGEIERAQMLGLKICYGLDELSREGEHDEQ